MINDRDDVNSLSMTLRMATQ